MWKQQAEALFFTDHAGITEIAKTVNKARETVSRHLVKCEAYDQEMTLRRARREKQRKDYQRQWDRDNRSGRYSAVNGESMKREHEIAVMVLSRERIY
jgi:IS30 family transposase